MRPKTQQFRKSSTGRYLGKISDNRRKTKAFSCTPAEWVVFEKFARYAKKQHRAESRQIVMIIQDFLAREDMINRLNNPKREKSLTSDAEKSENPLRVCDFPKGAENQSSENQNVNTIHSKNMNSLAGGLPKRDGHVAGSVPPGTEDTLFNN